MQDKRHKLKHWDTAYYARCVIKLEHCLKALDREESRTVLSRCHILAHAGICDIKVRPTLKELPVLVSGPDKIQASAAALINRILAGVLVVL